MHKLSPVFHISTILLLCIIGCLGSCRDERPGDLTEKELDTTKEYDEQSMQKIFTSRQLNIAESNWNQGIAKMKTFRKGIHGKGKLGSYKSIWHFSYPTFTCPFTTERLGKIGDGGKWVCGFEEHLARKPSCLIYSFGISTDTSFEKEILDRSFNCTIRMFDHTIKKPPPLVKKYPGRAFYYKKGIAGNNSGDLETLKTIMDFNGDTFIDILKMDVEGSEWSALPNILQDFKGSLPFSQVLFEAHLNALPKRERRNYFLNVWESMESAGLRPFGSEFNFDRKKMDFSEFSLLNIHVEPFKVTYNG